MSTYKEVFCAKLYEKTKEITAASLKGDPDDVLSSDITFGNVGADGILKMVEVVTTVLDTSIIIPNPVNTEASVYRIEKPEFTNNDLLIIDHNAVEFTKMYKDYAQTLTLFKRDNEWVL